jgi:hypothetical protein
MGRNEGALGSRLFPMFVGYMLAVLAAAAAASAIFNVVTAVRMLSSGAPLLNVIFGAVPSFCFSLFFGSQVIFIAALPVWIPVSAYAEWRSIRSLATHLIFGALASVPVVVALAKWSWDQNPAFVGLQILTGLMGGCAGGWAYWRVVGREAGGWREVSPAPDLSLSKEP